jgi:hypothetical protein
MDFKKHQLLAQNAKVFAFCFTENASLRQKLTETLYFLVHYKCFYEFKKIKFQHKIQK